MESAIFVTQTLLKNLLSAETVTGPIYYMNPIRVAVWSQWESSLYNKTSAALKQN